jgi:hypothetical protein
MRWFRTMTRSVRIVVALFLVAQFAGVVSSPLTRAHAGPSAVAAHTDHQHAHNHSHGGCAHQDGDQNQNRGDIATGCVIVSRNCIRGCINAGLDRRKV